MMRALVLFSGGLDSTTCLAMAVKKYGSENVTALSVFYGQKHKKEIEAAQNIAKFYGVELITLDLGKIFSYSDCSLLEGSSNEIPEGSYEEQLKETNGSPVSTYVPFRNGLFLSSAASIALSKNCSVIYYGVHSDDAAGNAYESEQVGNNSLEVTIDSANNVKENNLEIRFNGDTGAIKTLKYGGADHSTGWSSKVINLESLTVHTITLYRTTGEHNFV